MSELYYARNSRGDRQTRAMQDLAERGVCLFCELPARAEQPVLYEGRHWFVTGNLYPYKGTRLHLLLVPREHVRDVLDLTKAAQGDLWPTLAWVRERYQLEHYGLGSRNGDCRYTGGTIAHVHVHVLVGDVTDPDHEPVRMKFSSRV